MGLTPDRGGRILGFEAMSKGCDWTIGAALLACALACASGVAAGLPAGQELLGPLSREQILNILPECGFEKDSYSPATDALDRIRSAGVAIRIEAYFAPLDLDQVKQIGRLMKVQEAASDVNIVIDFVGLSRPNDPRAAGKAIEKLPTYIVFIDGSESGRIAGVAGRAPEEFLVSLLLRPADDVPAPETEDSIYADRDYFRGIPHAHLPIDCTRCHRPR